MLPHLFQFCIDQARTFQNKLLNLFDNRNYASIQLVEALAHVSKPATVVELSQETPFQRSYSVINKVFDAFGAGSLVTETINVGGVIKTVQKVDPIAFSKITKPFSALFFEMLPQETSRKFRLFALDATSTPRIHAHTLDSEDQVVVARGRTDRKGRRPIGNNQIVSKKRGRPRKYEQETIRFIEDMPPGSEEGSDEESEYEDTIKRQRVDVLFNRWNDVYVEGHSEVVDVVKVEIFSKHDYTKTLLPPLFLILSGKRRREITALDAYQSYRRRFDIEHFFRFVKQKLLFCAYQTPTWGDKASICYKDFSGTGFTYSSANKVRKIKR